jgi:hypothetical protein
MSGLFNAGSRNTQPNRLGSMQVQTSEFGVNVPILLGTNIVSPKLIDYVHFNATKTSQGGKGGGGVTGYEYYAAVLMLLSKATQYGGADGVGNIYDQSGGQQLTPATEYYTIPGGGGSYAVSHAGSAFYYDEGVTYQGSYSATVDDFGSDGLTTIAGFHQLPLAKTVGSPGALHYAVSATGTYTFAAVDAGKTVTISYAYTQQATHEAITSAPAEYLRLSFFLGTRPQSAWGYLAANYSTHAHNYPGLVMVADQNMDLGSGANVPTFNFELLNGGKLAFGGGIMDCDPAALVTTILTDPYIGAQFPWLGDMTQLSNYCVANGIFFSPYYETASAASQVIDDLAKLANSEPFWSWDGLLKIVPYGDTTVVGFGRQFTPVTQPLYDLTIDDFIQQGQEEPLAIDLPALADNSNYMKLEFRNRANSYNIDPISDLNQASVQQIGLRPCDTVTAHQITTANVAQSVLNALLTRKSYPYRKFRFKLNQCFPHLEKMDVVTVTHPNPDYGIVRWPVRIEDIEEDEKTAEITITAEDFPWGAGQPARFQRSPGGGGGKPGREYPGMVAAPIIFEPMDRMFRSGGAEIWIGVCGQTDNWGGCQVFLSTDGTDYAPIGIIEEPARMGTLLSGVGAVADPDTTTTFNVVLDDFAPPLVSASSAAADGWQTLSYLDGELIAYSTMTLVSGGGGGGSGAPTIPGGAVNSGILDNATTPGTWLGVHDTGTPGTSTGTSAYISPTVGRNFNFTYTGNGGERYSLFFASDTTSQNFCYDLEVAFTDPTQVLNMELDMNQVMADGRTVVFDCQCASGSGSWEYNNWHASTILGNPQTWGISTYHHIRIFWHRDVTGNITTWDGVEFDGVYTAFGVSPANTAASLGWAVARLVINFQIEGTSSGSGTVDAYGRNIQVWRW